MSLADEPARRYLLGELDATQEADLEAAALADAEAFAALELAEDDLYEAFARGELLGERRERFAARFLATPAGRQRLAVTRGLIARAPAAAPAPPAPVAWWRRPAVRLAFVIAALALAFALVRRWGPRPDAASAPAHR